MAIRELPKGLADLVAERLGLSISDLFQNALAPALAELTREIGVESNQLADALQAKPLSSQEWQTLINALTIGETRFLRQQAWFKQVELTVVAPLIASRTLQNRKHLRIWCAGCSTGEEPYTVAMILLRLIAHSGSWSISILATDIRRNALETAKNGEYPGQQFRELETDLMERFCRPAGARRYAIAPEVTSMVRFELGNLADVGAMNRHYDGGPYDLIICRHVLMYMVPAVQRSIAARLCGSLAEDGWIAVSAAEAMAEWFRPYAPVNAGEAILFCRKHRSSPSSFNTPQLKSIDAIGQDDQNQLPLKRFSAEMDSPLSSKSRDLDCIRSIADVGRLDEARELCTEVLEKDDMNADAAILLTAILIEVGDYEAALESARRAVYLESSVTAINLMAGALLNLGHTERAKRAFAASARLATALGDVARSDANHDAANRPIWG